MPTAKIAVSMDREIVLQLDRLVAQGVFPNRIQAIQQAVQERLMKM